jgi:hypothetical protein
MFSKSLSVYDSQHFLYTCSTRSFFYFLFGYHPKRNKKVTAIVKFAKTAPQKAKNLNVAGQNLFVADSKKAATSIFFNAFSFAVF